MENATDFKQGTAQCLFFGSLGLGARSQTFIGSGWEAQTQTTFHHSATMAYHVTRSVAGVRVVGNVEFNKSTKHQALPADFGPKGPGASLVLNSPGVPFVSATGLISSLVHVNLPNTSKHVRYRGYSKLRTHPALGPYGRSIPRSIGTS